MKIVAATIAGISATLAVAVGSAVGARTPPAPQQGAAPTAPAAPVKSPAPSAPQSAPTRSVEVSPRSAFPHSGPRAMSATASTAALSAIVKQYCTNCHNARTLRGNLNLENFNVDEAHNTLPVAEKMIRKLRADMMPPPGSRRPAGDSLRMLVETLERTIDVAARPNPGARTFQRLNRPEYERAIRDLLGVEINAGDYLPLDTKSANFDNIADAQALSPTLLEAYLNAAAAVSRIAIGDRNTPSTLKTYASSPFVSQHPWNHVEGAPYGTRGGIVTTHDFLADGRYTFRLTVTAGVGTKLEDIDISVDGERIALLQYERGVERAIVSADAPGGGDYLRTEPIALKAGQHRVSAAFVRRTEGPYEDLIKPHDWSRASNGTASAGTTEPPHILELAVSGPVEVTGVSETPSRRIIFSCHPKETAAQRACAERIITRLATKAYRRPLVAHDREGLLNFYDQGAKSGGFEDGVRLALQAVLASPHFVFRMERTPANVQPGQDYKISDIDLASRLSFFLWGTLPDDQLLALARQGTLSQPKTLERQVHRMLTDPRGKALATRFAAQWLRLQDLEKVRPDAFWFPDFDEQIAEAMRQETQLLFGDIVRRDASVLDLFTADYTFVNERLAKHYGITGITGPEFQRVNYPDDTRRGLLGHGSILVQTSLANRTSPVLRGKWVMEVLIGMPPPPPPPGVPDLEETKDSKDGKPLTTRERMELHRKDPTCRTCHQYMDPIGLALDNFDVTGRWRYRENGMPLDTRGQMYDGTPVTRPADLLTSLLKRPTPLMRSFTENLMAYAVGRRVEDYDQPTIRAITRNAEANGYRVSSFILGVVNSSAFRSKRADAVTDAEDKRQR